MTALQDFLKDKGYKKVRFKVSKTQHLVIKARINGILGDFILDTGASNSCIGFDHVTHFGLLAKASSTTASGAGGTGMLTQISEGNVLKMGRWHTDDFTLVIFDLSHVNEALLSYKAKPVHGIIGADVLLHGKAIIDYSNHLLYLIA